MTVTILTCYLCGVGVESDQWRCEADGETRHFCCEDHYHYQVMSDGPSDINDHYHHQVTREGQTLPWSIRHDPQYGRYLVASRDIRPGEIEI